MINIPCPLFTQIEDRYMNCVKALSGNYTICVSFGSVLIDTSPHYGSYFPAYLHFFMDSTHCQFYFGVGYFCILESFSWMHLSHLKAV